MKAFILPNGVEIFNTTPHILRFFLDGWQKPIEVESHCILSASAIEKIISSINNITYVTSEFVGTDEGDELINKINAIAPNAIIIGSMIAAQAYPNKVCAMVAHPDYMRVPTDQKRMLPNKFTIFSK